MALYLLIIQATTWVIVSSDTLSGLLCVGVDNATLFRGLLHINAVRKLVTENLMQLYQLSLGIFHSLLLSCSFSILILISGIARNVASGVRPHLLTSALLSRLSIPSQTTFSDGYNQTSPLYLSIWILRKVFIRPRTIYVLGLGPWSNIYIDMYSWAYHPYIIHISTKFRNLWDTKLYICIKHTIEKFYIYQC